MPHVELSLSDGEYPEPPGTQETFPERAWTGQGSSVRRWADVVATADEPCVVLNADGMIEASSPACRALLGSVRPGRASDSELDWNGRGLLDVLDLIDLTASGVPLAAWEAERIPPLLALATGNLARSLIRVRHDQRTRTVDVVAAPLSEGAAVVGSLSFFRRI